VSSAQLANLRARLAGNASARAPFVPREGRGGRGGRGQRDSLAAWWQAAWWQAAWWQAVGARPRFSERELKRYSPAMVGISMENGRHRTLGAP